MVAACTGAITGVDMIAVPAAVMGPTEGAGAKWGKEVAITVLMEGLRLVKDVAATVLATC